MRRKKTQDTNAADVEPTDTAQPVEIKEQKEPAQDETKALEGPGLVEILQKMWWYYTGEFVDGSRAFDMLVIVDAAHKVRDGKALDVICELLIQIKKGGETS